MSYVIDEVSVIEARLIELSWPMIEAEIKRIGRDEAAQKLGLATVGVDAFIWRKRYWRIGVLLATMERLELPTSSILVAAATSRE